MITKTSKGMTKPQLSAFWRMFSASCEAQGIPSDARESYRKQIMLELCGAEHMSQLNRSDDFDKLMLRLSLDSGEYALAAHYTSGDERRLAKMVEVTAHQLMQCQGTDDASAASYVAGLVKQAGFAVRQEGATYWMDLCAAQIHALFMALDTHRRRLLDRSGLTRGVKFDLGASYSRKADGTIELVRCDPRPAPFFRINIRA